MNFRDFPLTKLLTAAGLMLSLFFFSACASSEPATPKSAEEMALIKEQKAQEHRVFYEGWLHPN